MCLECGTGVVRTADETTLSPEKMRTHVFLRPGCLSLDHIGNGTEASISPSVSAKSNRSMLSRMWAGFLEPGMMILPSWMCQRRMIWTLLFLYFLASSVKMGSFNSAASP